MGNTINDIIVSNEDENPEEKLSPIMKPLASEKEDNKNDNDNKKFHQRSSSGEVHLTNENTIEKTKDKKPSKHIKSSSVPNFETLVIPDVPDSVEVKEKKEKLEKKEINNEKLVPPPLPKRFQGYVINRNTLVHKNISVDDFSKIKVIGKGRFGKVFLVKKKDSGEYLAMKIMKKKYVIRKKSVRHIKTERLLLAGINHPFTINLRYAFHDAEKLYLLMDFINGGELFYHLRMQERFEERRVKFYGAEVFLALEYLHKNNIIHRDLKPENLLIASDGHLILTDFGLSKMMESKEDITKTLCGTVDYLAPEMILMSKKKRRGYDRLVDWWGYGVLMYECLVGFAPFTGKTIHEVYQNVLRKKVYFPRHLNISSDAKDFIRQLLRKHPKKRLGFKSTEEIRKHPWFRDLNFDDVFKKKYQPEFIPDVKGEDDTQYINPTYLKMPLNTLKKGMNPEQLKRYQKKYQKEFQEFEEWGFNDEEIKRKPIDEETKRKPIKETMPQRPLREHEKNETLDFLKKLEDLESKREKNDNDNSNSYFSPDSSTSPTNTPSVKYQPFGGFFTKEKNGSDKNRDKKKEKKKKREKEKKKRKRSLFKSKRKKKKKEEKE